MVKECVFARLGLDALSPALLCSPAVVSSFALKLCLPDNASVMADSNSNTTRYPKSGGAVHSSSLQLYNRCAAHFGVRRAQDHWT